MVTMWLPPPATLLAAHELGSASALVARADYQPPYLLAGNLSDLGASTTLFAPTTTHASPTPTHGKALVAQRVAAKKSFRCPYQGCTQTSSNKGNLSKHIATRHEHRKDFVCPFKGCTRRFAKKYNMLRHLSASGVHRSGDGGVAKKASAATPRRTSERTKWSSMELDLARFLAMQCQHATPISAR